MARYFCEKCKVVGNRTKKKRKKKPNKYIKSTAEYSHKHTLARVLAHTDDSKFYIYESIGGKCLKHAFSIVMHSNLHNECVSQKHEHR